MTMEIGNDLDGLFSVELGENLKSISIQSNPEDHGRLKTLTQESGLTQGQVLRLILNLVDVRTARPGIEDLTDDSLPLSKLERLVLLTAFDSGLFTQQQLGVVIAIAKQGGISQSAMRIEAILRLMQSNLEHQNHFFDE